MLQIYIVRYKKTIKEACQIHKQRSNNVDTQRGSRRSSNNNINKPSNNNEN